MERCNHIPDLRNTPAEEHNRSAGYSADYNCSLPVHRKDSDRSDRSAEADHTAADSERIADPEQAADCRDHSSAAAGTAAAAAPAVLAAYTDSRGFRRFFLH